MIQEKTIFVYFDGEQVTEPTLMGRLMGTRVRGKELFSFEFDNLWLQNCCDVEANLRELFRRIAFNVAVSNCDDHLRNHGFIYSPKGWTLSPAYDLTPDEYGTDLKLCINESDSTLDFSLVHSIAPYLGISMQEASAIIEKVKSETSHWREVATKYGISRSEQELMQRAFCDK